MKFRSNICTLFPFLLVFLLTGSFCVVNAQDVPPVVDNSAATPVAPSVLEETKSVKAIEVVGNKTISIATILSKVKTRVGQAYLQEVISDDLKRLYNTGYFSDVRVDHQDQDNGFKVIFYVDEKSIVEEVTFSKTRYFTAKAIQKKLKTQVGKFLDNKSLKDDEETIKDLYSKKGLTSVQVDVETFVDETTNKASLHFVITEGYRICIKRINILGNSSYKDGRIIKVMKSRPKAFYRSGYLQEDTLREDMERITSYYEQNGYIDARVSNTTDMLGKGLVEVNVQIDEGKRYSVGSLGITGNSVLSNKEVLAAMESIQKGNVFSREKLSVDVANIRTLYFDQGYIFAAVNDTTSLDQVTGKVDVKIDIKEGGLAYLEKIKVQGNTRTRDVVVRRELKLYPGDRFDGAKLKRSKERLSNLGYFEDVNFDIEDTDYPDRKNLLVQVKEAKTGTFSFGGGFSTVDKIVGFVEIEQKNFDFTNWPTFTGGGQHLSLRAETGSSRNNQSLSFTEPWFFDHPFSFGFDIYRSQRDRASNTGYAYDEGKVGGQLRLGKQFSDILTGGMSYKFETVDISNFVENVSADLLAEEGTNNVSQLGFNLRRDTTDSSYNPTKGLVTTGEFDIAGGPLGGDKDFYRTEFSASYYIPLKFKSVFEIRGKAGIINSYGDSTTVPIFERYFAGGARTIRGYDERNVGPVDANTNESIGGESVLIANFEYTIPLIDFIKLAAFFDTGNVWADANDLASGDFKSGTGLGLRVKTPIGPINLDYGFPLNEEPGSNSKKGKFYFSVSRGF